MGAPLRPNRVQPRVCRRVLAEALGAAAAAAVLEETAIAGLPEWVAVGPRDLAALAAELDPFVRLYRALLARTDRATALAVARRAIVESGAIGHAHAAVAQRGGDEEGLNLTSPPPPGFRAPADELERRFALAMRQFSCEGRLLAYTPETVHFHVTDCNWCRAMHDAQTPELIEFFCETDERFMDHHPTHRLELPGTIGRGHAHCDFRFIPRGTHVRRDSGGAS
jgi:hypothetical protein